MEAEFDEVVKRDEPVSCVVLGDAEDQFSYANMNDAFNVLMTMEQPRLFTLGKG